MKKIFNLFLILSAALIFIACGKSGNAPITAYLIDAPIQGAKYINQDGKTGFTDKKGAFIYTGGEINFYIGKIKIGSVSKIERDRIVLIQEALHLPRNTGLDNELLKNTITFIQSLDTDPKTDIIELGENYAKFDKEKYNKHIKDLNIDELLNNENINKKDSLEVAKHFNASMEKYLRPVDRQDATPINQVPIVRLNDISIDDKIELIYPQKILEESLNNASITCLNEKSGASCNIKSKKVDGKKLILEISDLVYKSTYKITIDDKLTDYANKSLARVIIVNTSIDNRKIAPKVKYATYKDSKVSITFSKKMNSNTINSTNIKINSKKDSTNVDIKVNFDGEKVVTLAPKTSLNPNESYIVTVSTRVKDTYDLSLKDSYTLEFTTNEKIKHGEFTYKVIQSPITQRYWLDRNLGASSVCNSRYVGNNQEGKNNYSCYGDYFQWGRKANGHEKKDSLVVDTTKNPIEQDVETNGKFATWGVVTSGSVKNSGDWRQFPNDKLWNGASAVNNPCPAGFRIPTIGELLIETKEVDETLFPKEKVSGGYDTLENFLKIPPAGFRNYKTRDGIIDADLTSYTGYLWSSSTNDTGMSYALDFFPGGINASLKARASGYAVRCIKDYEKQKEKPLTVSSTSPSNGDTNVDVNATITIIFSKPVIIESSYRSRFTILDVTNNKQMNISYVRKISPTKYELPLSNGQAYPESFSNKMRYNTIYKISFNKSIKDISGKSIEANPVTFTTAQKLNNQNPKVINSNVKNGGTNVSRNENIRIWFNKDMDKNSFTSETVKLKDSSNNSLALRLNYEEISLDKWDKTKKDRVLNIDPIKNLEASKSYTLSLSTNIKDTSDKSFSGQEISFTTKAQNDISDKQGNIYQEVVSPKTSKVWLDRNLGASRVCESNIDKKCFGTYFKLSLQNDTICPTGFRIPTYGELENEFTGVNKGDLNAHFLKAAPAGISGKSGLYLSSSTQGDKPETKKVLYIPTYLLDRENNNLNISSSVNVRCIKGN